MHRNSIPGRIILELILTVAVLLPNLSAQSAPEVLQVAPAANSYAVPEGWTEERNAERVILSVPGDKALIYLFLFKNDPRETWQVTDEFAGNQTSQDSKRWTVVSKDIYRYGEKEVSKIVLDSKLKGQPRRRESVIAIPVEGGNLLLVSNVLESGLAEYGPAMERVIKSLLPAAPTARTPYPVSNVDVGLKLMVASGWTVEPVSQGEYSGVEYLKITRGNALLSLSSKEDHRTLQEYVLEVENNTKKQSKGYEKIEKRVETVAGIPGTRLELKTTTPSGVTVRRWVLVFSHNNRQYVVAAAAPESEFSQFADDFKQMIASVKVAQ